MTSRFFKFSAIKEYILLLLILIGGKISAQSTIPATTDEVYEEFQIIEQQNRFVDDFLNIGSGEQSAYNLPVGIKKIVGNIPITLAITNIKFGDGYGEITLLMKMDIPQKNQSLLFAADGIKLSAQGDLVGDIKLSLLSDIPLSLGNMGDLILKGSMDAQTGTANSKTYVSLECNGDFKELSLDADIVLNKNTFQSLSDPDKPVKASVRTVIQDWNDLIVDASFPTFAIKGINGFEFSISHATLDYSDSKNPATFHPNPAYFSDYFTLPDPNLWRGLYVDEFTMAFPEWFKKKDSNEKVVLGASHLLIDENGITGDIFGENIIPLQSGDISGWPFSVTDFRLSFLANNISGFGFGGQINAPLSDKDCLLTYKAYVSNDEYLFTANIGDSLDLKLFGNTQLRLDPTSYLTIALKNKQFRPRIVLNGSMGIDKDGLKMEQVVFHKLAIATESPVFSVESIEYGGEVKLNNFPVSISEIKLQMSDHAATLGFNLMVNLMEGKIAASSKLRINSEYKDRHWQYKSLDIDGLKLSEVQMAGFSLAGEIRTEKDHPVYGNYFGGEIKATFGALSDAVQVDVVSVFGVKDFRYWYVEGNVLFPAGIPVGPVSLYGFTGGAYYKMSATGKDGLEAYAPNKDCSLGLKAGVAFAIGSESAANGDALFEMNFLSGGGIKNIRFYGTAQFMSAMNLSNKLGQLNGMYKQAQTKTTDASKSYADNLPPNMNGSEIAKKVLPDIQLSMNISAYLTLNYDFPSKTFDADFKATVNTAGGFLTGTGNNNEAGWVKLHTSPQSWFVHIGTPTNPIGLKLQLVPLSITTTSYFMLGDGLEAALPPPQEVLNILQISSLQADYMKYPNDMKLGKGVAFGSRFSFDTGNLSFLILYAHFAAGTGFDVMLSDMSNYTCEGSNTPVGINGWYANGQCYAYLTGELGVRIKLLFVKKNITIIKGAAATLLQAKGPNPTWIGGYMALNLNVLGGLIKADMKMKFSFGEDCKLVSLNGSPLDFPVIADVSPLDNETDVDVFLLPQATFNMPVNQSFQVEDEEGNTKSYRIKLAEFYVADNTNQKIAGKIIWNQKKDAVSFESTDVLPSLSDLKVFVSVNIEEFKNGSWFPVTQNGQPVVESKTISFKTGEAPNYIPLQNIEYCYPVIDQKNFFVDESVEGYIQLKRGQPYLFPQGFIYQLVCTSSGGEPKQTAYSYNSGSKTITFAMPSLDKNKNYTVSLTVASNSTSGNANETKTETQAITDDSGETFSLEIEQQKAQQIIKEETVSILDYDFKTSQYATFAQKVSSINWASGAFYLGSDIRILFLEANNPYEKFDATELNGNIYTQEKPMIVYEAVLDGNYYTQKIKPLIYDCGIEIKNRDINIGAPPVRGFYIREGYLDGSNTMPNIFPVIYKVPYYYNQDYYEVRTKAANSALGLSYEEMLNSPYYLILNNQLPALAPESYKTRLRYILPDGKQSSESIINYSYWW
jgi:hypothetical protein